MPECSLRVGHPFLRLALYAGQQNGFPPKTRGNDSATRHSKLMGQRMNKTEQLNFSGWTCPRPLQNYPTIVMGHGSGGKMMADLIQHLFAPLFDNELLAQLGDSTVLELPTPALVTAGASVGGGAWLAGFCVCRI